MKVAKSLDEVRQYAGQILGMQLVTHQTGPEGQKVRRLLIEGADIRKEYYVAALTGRASQKVVVMASSEAGMDIEEVAPPRKKSSRSLSTADRADGQPGARTRRRHRHRHPRRFRAANHHPVQGPLYLLHGNRCLACGDQPA